MRTRTFQLVAGRASFEDPLRWKSRRSQAAVERNLLGRSIGTQAGRAEAHLGDLNAVKLVHRVKVSSDPHGSESESALGLDLGDAPPPGLLRQARKVLEGSDTEQIDTVDEKLKAHGRIGRADSATSANVTDSVADQDPEVE